MQEKHWFLSDTPFFSVITDIEYQFRMPLAATPFHDKLPLEILKSSAAASTFCSQKLLHGGTYAYAFHIEFVTAYHVT